jgi:hypothetical protein
MGSKDPPEGLFMANKPFMALGQARQKASDLCGSLNALPAALFPIFQSHYSAGVMWILFMPSRVFAGRGFPHAVGEPDQCLDTHLVVISVES